MPSREYLWVVPELSYGTPIGSPTTGTNAFYARLHETDSFSGQMNPVLLDVPYGGGRATPALQVSDQYTCTFSFKTYLYAGPYSALLCGWAMTPIDAGRTVPWVTTDSTYLMPPGDLASLSFYHAIQRADSTYDLRRYSGAKCLTWNISASRQSPIAVLSVTGQAIRDDLNAAGVQAYPTGTEFPAPTEVQYPTNPYLYSHTAGNLTLINSGSTVRTQYASLSLAGSNVMDPNWFESKYPQIIRFCGRTITLGANLFLTPTPDDLAFLQQKTQMKSSLVFNNGTNSLTFNLETNNYLKSVARNLPLNQVFKRQISVQNFWDATNSTDFTVTAA